MYDSISENRIATVICHYNKCIDNKCTAKSCNYSHKNTCNKGIYCTRVSCHKNNFHPSIICPYEQNGKTCMARNYPNSINTNPKKCNRCHMKSFVHYCKYSETVDINDINVCYTMTSNLVCKKHSEH